MKNNKSFLIKFFVKNLCRNDEEDCEPIPKKVPRDSHSQQHVRRRLPKRYSDLVGPLSTKIYLPTRDSCRREKPTLDSSSSSTTTTTQQNYQRTSTKGKSSEGFYSINSQNRKSSEIPSNVSKSNKKDHSIVRRRYTSKNKRVQSTNVVDLLAHRMQAAMSAELMYSLDRNFSYGEKKQSSNCSYINRSQSLYITKTPQLNRKENSQEHYYHIIPRVKCRFDDERKSIETISSIEELTPDYYDDDDIIIKPIKTNSNDEIGEEPAIDYDNSKSNETDERLTNTTQTTPCEPEVTASFIIQQSSTTPSSGTYTQERTSSSIPPTPPPLPTSMIVPAKTTFRCRTIADKITSDHRLILKDEVDRLPKISEIKSPGK